MARARPTQEGAIRQCLQSDKAIRVPKTREPAGKAEEKGPDIPPGRTPIGLLRPEIDRRTIAIIGGTGRQEVPPVPAVAGPMNVNTTE